MNPWFRFYGDAINDPKILRLPEATRWHWAALLCVASKYDGKLPAAVDIGLMLRVTTSKAASILTVLHGAGLLDKTETGFVPHNWSGRQYKSDVSTDRVKRFRNATKSVSPTVSETPPDTEQKQTTEQIDRIGEGASNFTESSKALSSSLWKALGFNSPLEIPPELAGADWRAIEWERSGWTADLIDVQARKIGPGKPLSYYEKVFATEFAKRQAPLPIVEIKQAEKLTVKNHGTSSNPNSLIGAIDRQIAALESADGPDPALSESPVLLLSSGSIR